MKERGSREKGIQWVKKGGGDFALFVFVLIFDEKNEQKERGEKGLQGRVEKGEGAYAIRSCGS